MIYLFLTAVFTGIVILVYLKWIRFGFSIKIKPCSKDIFRGYISVHRGLFKFLVGKEVGQPLESSIRVLCKEIGNKEKVVNEDRTEVFKKTKDLNVVRNLISYYPLLGAFEPEGFSGKLELTMNDPYEMGVLTGILYAFLPSAMRFEPNFVAKEEYIFLNGWFRVKIKWMKLIMALFKIKKSVKKGG